jgi:hypothetical protein
MSIGGGYFRLFCCGFCGILGRDSYYSSLIKILDSEGILMVLDRNLKLDSLNYDNDRMMLLFSDVLD